MSLFDILLVGHFVGDFLFQTNWMAVNKSKKWSPLFTHCVVYTAVVALFGLMGGGLSPVGIAVIFVGHVILDRKTFVSFWVRYIQTARGSDAVWLEIVADQIFHILLLALAIYLTAPGGL
ncbi:MAG TPA: DUF3307 domain-containing protein [Bacillales bacterium]|nr:DUF3307 domain-containing protein [Bacillales bacterium]